MAPTSVMPVARSKALMASEVFGPATPSGVPTKGDRITGASGPPLPHQRRGDILGGVDADHRRRGRQGAHLGDEGARCGLREMRAHRVDALPLLDEHQPVGVFDIDMAIMRQTPRLGPRPRAMFGAEGDHAIAMFGGEDDVAGDQDHARIHFLTSAQPTKRLIKTETSQKTLYGDAELKRQEMSNDSKTAIAVAVAEAIAMPVAVIVVAIVALIIVWRLTNAKSPLRVKIRDWIDLENSPPAPAAILAPPQLAQKEVENEPSPEPPSENKHIDSIDSSRSEADEIPKDVFWENVTSTKENIDHNFENLKNTENYKQSESFWLPNYIVKKSEFETRSPKNDLY